MEMEAALTLWKRSTSLGFRYITVLSDGDCKTFNYLCEKKVYGPDIVIKRKNVLIMLVNKEKFYGTVRVSQQPVELPDIQHDAELGTALVSQQLCELPHAPPVQASTVRLVETFR
ncbi:hypothetical protein TNCV_4362631 [Trichonephila clavipes]|nr:hypothetical protein TNCV_4362631 [Trichonephila clavipes]